MATEDGTIAWSSLLREATEHLGSDDARRIVEEITGADPGMFHTALDQPVTERGIARFDAMVQRRAAGEPLQYVLGRWGFRTLDLMVDRRVLIPRPETEMVAGAAIDDIRSRWDASRDVHVVDLGTGSGAIALSIAVECTNARVMATDSSADALVVAGANLAGIGRAATRVSLHEGAWFAALPSTVVGKIDVIVSNPPYVRDSDVLPPVVEKWEPSAALRAGPDGLDDLRLIVDEGPRWLDPIGTLVLEMAPDQTGLVAKWCRDAGFEAEVMKDLAGRDRAVVARRGQAQ